MEAAAGSRGARRAAGRRPLAAFRALAEAFAALLDAEQDAPVAAVAGPPPASSDAVIDEVVRRVTERLQRRRDARRRVVDVAERLVREEIDRIKSA